MLPGDDSESAVDLTMFTAEVAVTVDQELSEELNRCMKKGLPPRLKYGLIYVSFQVPAALEHVQIHFTRPGSTNMIRAAQTNGSTLLSFRLLC